MSQAPCHFSCMQEFGIPAGANAWRTGPQPESTSADKVVSRHQTFCTRSPSAIGTQAGSQWPSPPGVRELRRKSPMALFLGAKRDTAVRGWLGKNGQGSQAKTGKREPMVSAQLVIQPSSPPPPRESVWPTSSRAEDSCASVSSQETIAGSSSEKDVFGGQKNNSKPGKWG